MRCFKQFYAQWPLQRWDADHHEFRAIFVMLKGVSLFGIHEHNKAFEIGGQVPIIPLRWSYPRGPTDSLQVQPGMLSNDQIHQRAAWRSFAQRYQMRESSGNLQRSNARNWRTAQMATQICIVKGYSFCTASNGAMLRPVQTPGFQPLMPRWRLLRMHNANSIRGFEKLWGKHSVDMNGLWMFMVCLLFFMVVVTCWVILFSTSW